MVKDKTIALAGLGIALAGLVISVLAYNRQKESVAMQRVSTELELSRYN